MTAPARVVVVHPSDEMYGADKVLLEVTGILRAGAAGTPVDVHVLLPDDVDYPDRLLSTELTRRGVPVDVVALPVLRRDYLGLRALPGLVRRAWSTWRLLRRERPDVVYLSTSATLAVAPLARAVGARTVLHVHETWSGTERRLLGPLLRACGTVLAVSRPVADALPLPAGRATVVHNGFDVPVTTPGRAADLRAELGVGDDEVLALVASRWNAWKGHDVLLEAWAGLARTDLHLAVLGAPPPSGGTVDVPTIVRGLPDPTRVHVVGERTDVADWVCAADVVLVPSTRPDPLPTIAIEAAALGRAVLASDSGGLPDIVDDGRSGALVATGDAAAWCAALTRLDRAELVLQGEHGRGVYAERFRREAFRDRFARAVAGALDEGEHVPTSRGTR
ncbi:glycosyltransferase family 4 protein [Cellulomonas sp. S1-8]|uniref:glycosyltransferase family 4 protein n=1 Tax=Cellulomonas sp. S1-8 TaxID=2904790 RepID=UPI002243C010|nr:glycosyltransferase family 4 protein [Cellulomonas sp. S1-8]UZN04310.1 glycosyltransferase family 4 protein [Cellulomonas sp. S1-8]